jgi:OOP family OmpA-OmpF porin
MRSFAILAVLASLTSAPAWADDESGVFVGVSGGRADLNETLEGLDLGSLGVELEIEDLSPAWSAFGGYRLNRNVGFRAGYVDFQTFDDLLEVSSFADVPDIQFDLEGWMVGVDAYLPLGRRVSLAGRAGYMDWQSRVKVGEYDFRSAESGTEPFFGGGIEVNLGRHFGLETSYTRFDVNGSDVDYASVALHIGF